jgi:VanZ family protein
MSQSQAPRTGRWVGLWLGWMAVIAISSHVPGAHLPPEPYEGVDKTLHVAIYAVWAVLGAGSLARLLPEWPRPLWGSSALLLGALFGAADEYHQSFVAGRQASMEDWLTNLLGLALAVIVARAARGRLAAAWLGVVDAR